ncbi:helix-turn-helix transcriptional regulator [Nonomuraea sp. NPDC055795]
MPRPERPIDPRGPIADLAIGLRALRRQAGLPYRQMASMTHYGLTTLAGAAAGRRPPSWSVTQAYVSACGGLPKDWLNRWQLATTAWKAINRGTT